jgi:hypothetical protein
MTPLDVAELERLDRDVPGKRWEKNVVLFTDARIWLPEEDVGFYVRAADSALHGKMGELVDGIVASRNALPELIAALKIAVVGLREISAACYCTELCVCSSGMSKMALIRLTEIRKLVSIE